MWHDGLVYVASNAGKLFALDAKTGQAVLQTDLPIPSAGGTSTSQANLYPSMTLAGKKLLVGNDAGNVLVLAPGNVYKELANNKLEEGAGACPVPDGKFLFLRGGELLYCIGEKGP